MIKVDVTAHRPTIGAVVSGRPTVDVAVSGGSGIPGPPGPPGGSYVHTQGTPSPNWVIVHSLGFYPAGIVVFDSAGNQVDGDISYPSLDTVVIEFSAGFAGVAYLS